VILSRPPDFDNAVVCQLIEEKRPAGIYATLNDAGATAHADPSAADNSFVQRLSMLGSNPNFETRGQKFLIRHYAGDVMYNVPGMTDKNKDSLIKDILDLVDSSKDQFLHTLFPEKIDPSSKKRPPTASDKIKVTIPREYRIEGVQSSRKLLLLTTDLRQRTRREPHEVGWAADWMKLP
jgi:myosin-1